MAAGFQLFGPTGALWADTNFMPCGLIKSGYLPNTSILPDGSGGVSITVQARSPVIFFRTTGGNYWNPPTVQPQNDARVDSVSVSGNTWTFKVEANVLNGTVSYYIFDPMITATSNTGFQVFNELGEIIFNSYHPPLRVTQWVLSADEYSVGYMLYAKTPVTLPTVAAFSMSMYRRGFTTSDTTQPYSDFYKTMCGITSDNTGVYSYGYLTETSINVGGGEAVWTNQGTPYLSIADVSNCPVPFG